MKTLGIIRGIGPESTIEYYRRVHALYRQRIPDGSAPSIIINSIDNKKLLGLVEANKLNELTVYLGAEVERLARGGATFGLLADRVSLIKVSTNQTASTGRRPEGRGTTLSLPPIFCVSSRHGSS